VPKLLVHESRRLLLPLATAVDAVLELDREHGGTLGLGKITAVSVQADADAVLVLSVERAGSLAVQRAFTKAALAAAFIHYCWKSRIPLPRHGTKRIEVVPEGFAIIIEGTVHLTRRHGPLPQSAAPLQPA
jgi:hypothetical protein